VSLEDEFNDYHKDNPLIYRYIDQFAREAIQAGYKNFGMAMIWERMRWEIMVKTRDQNFKFPNNHRAYYSRLWNKNNPNHPNFFRTAVLRSTRYVEVDRFGRDLLGDPLEPDVE
jgi:hypothetical protein